MSLFDELMKHEQYRKIFDEFPDDQKPLIIERIRSFMDETESKIINPFKEAAENIKKVVSNEVNSQKKE